MTTSGKFRTVTLAALSSLFCSIGWFGLDAEGRQGKPKNVTGKTYYVSPHGENTNSGTSREPWATPGYGSRKLKPGDTLVILGGRYVLRRFDEDIIKPPSGNAGAWVFIKGEKGNRPVLAGRDNLMMAIDLSGTSYVSIENL